MRNPGNVDLLSHARLRYLQKLQTARGRREQRRFLIDGEKLICDAIDATAPIEEILSTSPELWREVDIPVLKMSRADSERLSDTRTPQGHIAVLRDELGAVRIPTPERWQIVALDAVQDPGNVGGIIRSAAAFGVDTVLVGPGSADPTHQRVTRAATGAWFHVRIARSQALADDLAQLRAHGATVLAADQRGRSLDEQTPPDQAIWLFGNEGSGISDELEPLIDASVAVRIAKGIDSLNVNVSAGIILHYGQHAGEYCARERNEA